MTAHVYRVVDPATGTVEAEYPTETASAIESALERSARTHRDWSRTSTAADRSTLLRAVADLHIERRDELASTIRREMGKPLDQAAGEVEFSAAIYSYYAEHAESFLADEPIELLEGEGHALVRRQSIGPLLGVMPWNFPTYQVARFAAPNLALGNTIVLKHAPQCPESAAAIERIFLDAGFPEGAYTNIYASFEQVADVIADPRVQGVSFTGSERAGSVIAAQAGRHLKKVVLELGGSDPFLVFSTSDLDATVEAALDARFDNTGQVCNGAKRFLVVDELYEGFVQTFTAGALARAAGLTPLASEEAATRLEEQVARAVGDGANVVSEGRRNGAWFPPTVITDLPPTAPSAGEELFGPVAMIHRVADEDEAVELANATAFGLGSYVFTSDPDQAMRVADRIEAGMVFVNGVGLDGVELPFGGTKRSGFGRELGRLGIEEFANRKLIRVVPAAGGAS